MQIDVVVVTNLIDENDVRSLLIVQLKTRIKWRFDEILIIRRVVLIKIEKILNVQRSLLEVLMHLVQLKDFFMQLTSIHDDNNVSIILRDHDEREYLRIVTFVLNVKLIRESHVISILE